MIEYYSKIVDLLKENRSFVQVSILETKGSVPAYSLSKMIVSANGYEHGTIGGGSLEKNAIDYAINFLKEGHQAPFIAEWDLYQDFGMTCGGKIKVLFEIIYSNNINIVIFGAGHVANALIKLLITLECYITCIDFRHEWLDKLPDSFKIKAIHLDDMSKYVEIIPSNSFVMIMTTGHKTDWAVLKECLKRNFRYVGLVGSQSKKKWIKNQAQQNGLPHDAMDRVHCPIGLPIGSNHPAEVAVSIVAEILQERDKLTI